MDTPPPYIEPPHVGPTIVIHTISYQAPLRWLALGWLDFIHTRGLGLVYGLVFWAMAVIVGWVFSTTPEYAMSIASGCLLVGPFLALGLYEMSRCRELGLPITLWDSLTCWRTQVKSMGVLVLVLMVLELLWGRASLIVFAIFFNTGMPSNTGVLQAIFNFDNMDFLVAYVLVGGFFAFVVFATSAVSIALMRDQEVDAITAVITSVRVVTANTLAMLIWGALLTLLVAVALLPFGAGLLVIGPWLGHATWHAYRATVSYQLPPSTQ